MRVRDKTRQITIDNREQLRYNTEDNGVIILSVIKYRTFYDVEKEEKWLNKQGQDGLLLVDTVPFGYTFDKTHKKWTYSMEWLDSSPDTEENAAYIKKRSMKNCFYCGKKNCYAYFASEGNTPPAKSASAFDAISKRYTKIAVFAAVIAVFLLLLVVYNFVWQGRFNDLEYVNKDGESVVGYTAPYDSNEIVGAFKWVVGKNPASLFLAFLIPIAALFASYDGYLWYVAAKWKGYAAQFGGMEAKR